MPHFRQLEQTGRAIYGESMALTWNDRLSCSARFGGTGNEKKGYGRTNRHKVVGIEHETYIAFLLPRPTSVARLLSMRRGNWRHVTRPEE